MNEEKLSACESAKRGQTESSDATAGLLLAPDIPDHAPCADLPRKPVVAYRNARKPAATRRRSKVKTRANKMTLEEAFEWSIRDGRNDERAIRASAFLLDWATEEGNAAVDPCLAQGISRVLILAMENMHKEHTAQEQQRERAIRPNET